MKTEHAQRVALLTKALGALPELEAVLAGKGVTYPPEDGDVLGLDLGAGVWDHDGGTGYANALLDAHTARKLLPHLRRLIVAELRALGVAVEEA